MSKKSMMDDYNEDELFSPPPVVPQRPASAGNPLAKYFRMPGVNIGLPTKGAFYPKGSVNFSDTKELSVFPMTAADEILIKSPDALMSGYALEKLIESCVPSIKNAKMISTPDLDALLIAIRIASNGNNMDVDITCPKCKGESTFSCDLPNVVATMTEVPSEIPVRLTPEIVAYVRPFNLQNATRMSLLAFEQTRKLQALESEDDATRLVAINESYDMLNRGNIAAAADCVIKIVVPDGVVTDKKSIVEFVTQTRAEHINKIDEKIREINKLGIDRNIDVLCPMDGCGHQWRTEIQFDPSTFFAQSS